MNLTLSLLPAILLLFNLQSHWLNAQVQAQYSLQITNSTKLIASTLTVNSLAVSIITTATNTPITWSTLLLDHQRYLHCLFISQDLQLFAHIHPEDFGTVSATATSFPLQVKLPRLGRYAVVCNFELTVNGVATGYTARNWLDINTAGVGAINMLNTVTANTINSQVTLNRIMSPLPITASGVYTAPIEFNNYTYNSAQINTYNIDVSINNPTCNTIYASSCTRLQLAIKNSTTSVAVTNMIPYLGAIAHVAVISADLTYVAHGHAMTDMGTISCAATSSSSSSTHSHYRRLLQVTNSACSASHATLPSTFVSPIDFFYTFPAAGNYKIVFQFMTNNQSLVTSDFIIQVSPAKSSAWSVMTGTSMMISVVMMIVVTLMF